MDIIRAGSQPSGKGPAKHLTGTLRIDRLNAPLELALVTFEPGARNARYIHPLGQPLIDTAGCGTARGWPV
jgi:quercetin dioxygenase-like cupin family protein